jgi:hypothetical protein
MPPDLMPDQTAMEATCNQRNFIFERDSFAFPNELVWAYQDDPVTGKMTFSQRHPKPTYAHRCFALARVTRQFFYHAQFELHQPIETDEIYSQRVRAVIARHPRIPCKSAERIIIPGFAGLREFSRAQENLLKTACGGAWRSYFVRSHWRMIFPFSRVQQARTALALATALRRNYLPIVHLVKFPALTINHAIVLFGIAETGRGWEFKSYDPNNSDSPERLEFDRKAQTFFLEPNSCWGGGELNVSHICRSCFF